MLKGLDTMLITELMKYLARKEENHQCMVFPNNQQTSPELEVKMLIFITKWVIATVSKHQTTIQDQDHKLVKEWVLNQEIQA